MLQLVQPILASSEGIIRKVPSGEVHVPPRGLSAWSDFRMRGREKEGEKRGEGKPVGKEAEGFRVKRVIGLER